MKIIKKTLNVEQSIRYIKELFFYFKQNCQNTGHVSQTEEGVSS